MNKKLFIYNTSWTVTSLLPVVKSWILAVVKIKDLVGLQQKMVTKNLANVRSDALRHLDFFFAASFQPPAVLLGDHTLTCVAWFN